MNWQAFTLFFLASLPVFFCSDSNERIIGLKYSPGIIDEFKKLEMAFATKKVAPLRDPSYRFHDGSTSYVFHDLCTHAFEYALDTGNWSFSHHLFNEFWKGPVIFNICPSTGKYCRLALAHNEMNQVKISFNLIQTATDKKIILFQAIKERKFVLVGFEPTMNWDLLSQTDFLRIFRSAIKYKQFSQVYQCLGSKFDNFAFRSNHLLNFAIQMGQRGAIETLLAHHEVFASRPQDLHIAEFGSGFEQETSYSVYLGYYFCRNHSNEHLLRPFWQNFYRIEWIDNKLALILLRRLERTPLKQGQSPYSCLARLVRILSASDLPISALKKFSVYLDTFGIFNVAINSGNAKFIDYVLQRYDPTSFHFDTVAFAEQSLTRGTVYALNHPLYIKFLKASYAKGHLDHIISILKLIGEHNSFSKIQATKITRALFINFPEIVWIVSKNINPFYFTPREGCWLTEAVNMTDYTEKLPKGCSIADKWRDLMMKGVYSNHMKRLILATYGVYDMDDCMNFVAICMHLGDFDSALMALKTAHGQFQLESPRLFLPGIINHDLPLANKIFSTRRFFPVIKLKESPPPQRLSQDRTFYEMLFSSIIEVIEADHKPLLRCILNNFDIRPHDILSSVELVSHHNVIGACYGWPDWSKLCFKSYGPVQVFLATCPMCKVNKILPYFGKMNTLQIIKACLLLESEVDCSK